jgi:hypothetical protein
MKLVSSPVLLLLGVLACAALVPAAEGGLVGGLGFNLDTTLPLGLEVHAINEEGGENVTANLPGGSSFNAFLKDPGYPPAVEFEGAPSPSEPDEPAEEPSPARKLLGVVRP